LEAKRHLHVHACGHSDSHKLRLKCVTCKTSNQENNIINTAFDVWVLNTLHYYWKLLNNKELDLRLLVLTSIEPKKKRECVFRTLSFHKVIIEGTTSTFIHSDIPSILRKTHLGLPWKNSNSVFLFETLLRKNNAIKNNLINLKLGPIRLWIVSEKLGLVQFVKSFKLLICWGFSHKEWKTDKGQKKDTGSGCFVHCVFLWRITEKSGKYIGNVRMVWVIISQKLDSCFVSPCHNVSYSTKKNNCFRILKLPQPRQVLRVRLSSPKLIW